MVARKGKIPLRPLEAGSQVVGYCRDSGGAQQTHSVEDQKQAVSEWCAARFYVVVRWYLDFARPGSNTESREAFLRMIAEVPALDVAAVVVWDTARFSRSTDDSLYFRATLRRQGVNVISISDSIPEGPLAPVVESVLDLVAEQKLVSLSRDVKRGLAAAVLQGRHPGSRPPAGYKRIIVTIGQHRDGTPRTIQRWQVDTNAAEQVRAAFRLYATGTSMREIHAQLDLLPSYHAYRHLFANAIYIGQVQSGELVVTDPELRIVDDATWSAVQERRARRIPPRRVRSTHVLSGLLFCGACGRPMSGTTDTRREHSYRYYRCTSAVTLAPPTCAKRVPAAAIETPVLETVLARLTTPATIDAILSALQAQADTDPRPAQARTLDAQIGQAEKAITMLLDLAETGTLALGEIRRRLAERESALAALRQQRAGLPVAHVAPFDAAKFRSWLAGLVTELQAGPTPVVRRALAQVIAKVVYDPATGIEIIYRENIGV
jgi:DNA invertase Pin-like site-specific DNA recombinase